MLVWPTFNRGLVYHKVAPELELGLTTNTPNQFKAQMLEIQRLGFTFANLRDGDEIENPVYVTFDDAYECILEHAYPVLQNVGGKATVYVISDYIGKKNSWDYFGPAAQVNHLNWDQIRELDRAGWEIGSHGRSHRNLLTMPSKERQSELLDSKRLLEDKLGHEVSSFCPAYNRWNQQLLDEISAAGYSSLSMSYPLEPLPAWDGFILARLGIYLHDIMPLFRTKLQRRPLTPISVLSQMVINSCARTSTIIRRLQGDSF